MTNIARKTRLVDPALITLVLLGLTAAACFSDPSGASPDAPSAISQVREAVSEPTVVLTKPPALPTPTLAPTSRPTVASLTSVPTNALVPPTLTLAPPPQPTVASPTATRTVVPEMAPADGEQPSTESAAIFGDLALLEERAFSYLSEMSEDLGVRTSGTDLEHAAAQFLVGRLEELGYSPEVQEFSWDSPTASLDLARLEPGSLDANTLTGTAGGQATAPLVLVGLAKPEDIPAQGLDGKIALIERGEITFGSKVARVHDAGAVAAIIYNNERGNFRGTLGGRSRIPAISLSQIDGRKLKEFMDRGEPVEATVAVRDNTVLSRNVIGELPGAGEGVIVIGAHYDTVPDSIGASDNSSGLGVLLAMAERLEGRSFPFSLRFVAFGSEETGLHGSEYYVESLSPEELEDIYLMINVDSVGSGNRLAVSGDRWVVGHVKEVATRQGISLEVSARAEMGSDHANFRDAWVPTVFFRSNDLSRINTPADTMEHINRVLLGDVAALALDLLENVHTLPGYGH